MLTDCIEVMESAGKGILWRCLFKDTFLKSNIALGRKRKEKEHDVRSLEGKNIELGLGRSRGGAN